MDSETFSTHLLISISRDATVMTGMISRRPALPSEEALSAPLSSSMAALQFRMCVVAADGRVIAINDEASSFKAFPDSELIFVHGS